MNIFQVIWTISRERTKWFAISIDLRCLERFVTFVLMISDHVPKKRDIHTISHRLVFSLSWTGWVVSCTYNWTTLSMACEEKRRFKTFPLFPDIQLGTRILQRDGQSARWDGRGLEAAHQWNNTGRGQWIWSVEKNNGRPCEEKMKLILGFGLLITLPIRTKPREQMFLKDVSLEMRLIRRSDFLEN